MAVTLEQFVDQLVQTGLMSADEVGALIASLPEARQVKDAEGLARELVKQKRLTAFQAQEIYAGRSKYLVLGNYVVLDKLGQGGMGMVLKAEHRRMKRPVALKVLSPKVTKSPEALRRFQREVEAAAKLRHPNIVAADDADEAAGAHFLVMEFVEGSDLSALVKRHGPLALDRALNCIVQAARGLEYAHARGVVHRDIKPANLLLDTSGTVKILDMGLARLQSASADQDELTGTGQIMGTVDYMAPEQALSTRNADARADIYSLGITLWYLLSAQPMYDGETAIAKLLAHQSMPIPQLAAHCPIVTPALQAAFAKMVAKTPAERYQSMTAVIAALEPFRGMGASAATIATSSTEDPQLAAFLREANSAGGSRSAVAKGSSAKAAAAEMTINTGMHKVETDPQTQNSLPRPLPPMPYSPAAKHTSVSNAPARRFIAGGVGAVVVLTGLLVWAIFFRNRDPGRDATSDDRAIAKIEVPTDGTVTVAPASESTTSKAAPPKKSPSTKPFPSIELPATASAAPKSPVPKSPPQPSPAIPAAPPEEATLPVERPRTAIDLPEIVDGTWKVVDARPIDRVALGARDVIQPRLSADGLALVFASSANSESDLMVSTRTSATSSWSKAVWLSDVNSGVQDNYGCITQDQLCVIFFSQRSGDHLWMSTRLQADRPFRQATKLPLSINGQGTRSWYPGVSASRRWMTYVREVTAGENRAYIAERTGLLGSSAITRALGAEIDALGYCRGAAVTDDGLMIVVDMGEQMAGRPSALWSASRETLTAPFVKPVKIGDFSPNSDGNILNPTLSGDGRTLWFCRQGELICCERTLAANASLRDLSAEIARLTAPDYEWTEPEDLGPEINTGSNEWSPSLSQDGLSIVFARGGNKNPGDLFESSRASLAELFVAATPIAALNSPETETDPFLSADGLTLIFASTTGPNAQGEHDLYLSQRAHRNASWGPRVNFGPVINGPKSESSATMSQDGLTMYFRSSREGSLGGMHPDLWRSRRADRNAPWETPVNLGPPVNTTAAEENPDLAPDGQTLLFGRLQDGRISMHLARQGSDGQWKEQTLELPGDLASRQNYRHPTLASDGSTLYFSSSKPGSVGLSDLWMIRRVPKKIR